MKPQHEQREVKVDKLIADDLQIRVEMQEECVEEYAAIYREGRKVLPPIVVFYDVMGDTYYLADGFHRVAAAKLNGTATILAEVYEGTFEDALRYALRANANNGIRRTNEDKLHALEIVWAKWDTLYRHEKRTTEDGLPSVRQLMSLCNVTNHFARTFIDKKKVCESHTPVESDDCGTQDNGALGDRALPDSVGGDHRAPRADRSPDATTVTHDHTEERNASVRDLLKQGKDRYGMDIPERILPAFLSREPRDIMKQLGELRKMVDDRHMHGDITYAHIGTDLLMKLEAAIRTVRFGMAHCVCRMCRGRGCGSCSDLGFQTRLQYGRVPREYKAENQ